jgi:hypothetical protein
MADELGHAGDAIEQPGEPRPGEVPRLRDADRPVVGPQLPGAAAGAAPQGAQDGDRAVADRVERPEMGPVVDDSNIADAVLSAQPDQEVEDPGQLMEMLVAVGMVEPKAGTKQLFDLGPQLALEVDHPDPAGEIPGDEAAEASMEAAGIVDQRRDVGGAADRPLFDERQVDSDAERRRRPELFDRIVERQPVRDDAAGRDDSFAVTPNRAGRHGRMQSDIVGRDDKELVHGAMIAGGGPIGDATRLKSRTVALTRLAPFSGEWRMKNANECRIESDQLLNSHF